MTFRLVAGISLIILIIIFVICFIFLVVALDAVSDDLRAVTSTMATLQSVVAIIYVFGLVLGSAYFIHQVFSWTSELDNKMLRRVRNKTIWICVSFAGLVVSIILTIVNLVDRYTITPQSYIGTSTYLLFQHDKMNHCFRLPMGRRTDRVRLHIGLLHGSPALRLPRRHGLL